MQSDLAEDFLISAGESFMVAELARLHKFKDKTSTMVSGGINVTSQSGAHIAFLPIIFRRTSLSVGLTSSLIFAYTVSCTFGCLVRSL